MNASETIDLSKHPRKLVVWMQGLEEAGHLGHTITELRGLGIRWYGEAYSNTIPENWILPHVDESTLPQQLPKWCSLCS